MNDTVAKRFLAFESLFKTILEVTKHQLRLKNPNLSERELHIKTLEQLHNMKIHIDEKHT
jgi:hypothetical protein